MGLMASNQQVTNDLSFSFLQFLMPFSCKRFLVTSDGRLSKGYQTVNFLHAYKAFTRFQLVKLVKRKSSSLVGTSETLRVESSEEKFNAWLGGIIDGDGSLLVSKNKLCSCEITMDSFDYSALMSIKNKLGGSVKLRSGVKAYRYRLQHKEGMLNLVKRINGHIRNSKRIPQLLKVCAILGVTFVPPMPLTKTNAWFSGFFDADGTIVADFKRNSPIISISVSNKFEKDVVPFLLFNGSINYDKAGYGYYRWRIASQKDIFTMLEYFKECPSRSHKLARIHLIKEFYLLKSLKAHQATEVTNFSLVNRWATLQKKWYNLGFQE